MPAPILVLSFQFQQHYPCVLEEIINIYNAIKRAKQVVTSRAHPSDFCYVPAEPYAAKSGIRALLIRSSTAFAVAAVADAETRLYQFQFIASERRALLIYLIIPSSPKFS